MRVLPGDGSLTTRAVCLGGLIALAVTLVMGYNDWYLGNSLLIGNHFPYIALVAVFGLGLAGNAAARWLGAEPLRGGELMLIWGMVGVAGGIGGAGLMRYLPSWLVAPAYCAGVSPEAVLPVVRALPGWMLVSQDPDAPAVRWFMEGLPRGERIPWGAWIGPLAAWGAFALMLYASNFAVVSLLLRQWSRAERLVFPVIHLPVETAKPASPGALLNGFLRDPLTWTGAAVPLLVWGVNGLGSYLPGLPAIPVSWGTWGLFADRPWSEFNLEWINLYFTMIGIAFLLTAEVSFSLWFVYVLYRLSFVFVAAQGAGVTGFFSHWGWRVPAFAVTGGILAMAAHLLWTARSPLRAWFGRAVRGADDEDQDPLPPRLTFLLACAGIAGMVAWTHLAGASWWAAALATGVFLAMLLFLTRVVAETGLIFVQSGAISYDVLTGLFPASWLPPGTVNTLAMQKAVWTHDHREILLPYVMNGVEGTSRFRVRPRAVLAVFAATAVVALGVSAYAKISTSYKYGALQMDVWANVMTPESFLGGAASYSRRAAPLEWITTGGLRVFPVNAAHLVGGGGTAALLLVLRSRFPWWPVHPFGLIMCAPYTIGKFWFSLFLGWLAKSLVMKFGGAHAYRRALPFFLGLALGESLMAAFWTLVGLLTGTPGIAILPS